MFDQNHQSAPGLASSDVRGPPEVPDLEHTLQCTALGRIMAFVMPGVAHDFGNALQAASLHLDILKMRPTDLVDESSIAWGQSAKALDQQLDRLRALSAALFEQSLLQEQGPAQFDPRELIDRAVLLLQTELRHRRIAVEMAGSETALLTVGQPGWLRLALLDALITVVRAVGEDGKLIISVGLEDDYVWTCFSGIGHGMMTVEALDRVTADRGEIRRERPVHDVYAARRLVEKLGGTLAINADPSRGLIVACRILMPRG